MPFQPIDLASYPRREHYDAFFGLKLTYSATIQIDITRLLRAIRDLGFRTYPVQIWLLTEAANRIPEFRMSQDGDGRLGIWDQVSPLYTTLNPTTRTFSGIWTPFDAAFPRFYAACIDDMARYTTGEFQPQHDLPENVLNISSLPWVDFTSFNLNMPGDYLLPILTLGRYIEENGRTILPLAIQVHHAVCDGLHLGAFISEVRALVEEFDRWLHS